MPTMLLLDCPQHGQLMIPAPFSIGGEVRITSSTVNCPKCGRQVPIVDTTYTATSDPDSPRMVIRPTPQQLRRLLNTLEWAQRAADADTSSQERVAAQVRQAAERDAPGLLRAVDAITGPRGTGIAAWLAVMLALVQLLLSGQQNGMSAADVERIVEQVLEHEHTAEPPMPTPPEEPPSPGPSEPGER